MHPLVLSSLSPFLAWLDIAGVAVFAASGALAAARAERTIVTFCFFALVTGTGGGTIRDLLIGAPVFWMHRTLPVAICLVVATLVWITPQRWWSSRAIDWFDAVGLAAYAVYGASKAISAGVPPLPGALMGVGRVRVSTWSRALSPPSSARCWLRMCRRATTQAGWI
jgi:uncharacterized membrane protein YeiH